MIASQQHSNPHRPRPLNGFSLVELLVVIGIIVILIALLLPAISVVRARVRSAHCQSNLAELGIAVGKANGAMPQPLRSAEWTERLPEFLDAELFNCPSELEGGTSYGMNDRVHRMQSGDGKKIVMFDYRTEQAEIVRTGVADQNWDEFHDPRHRGQVNVLLHSGVVVTHSPESINPAYCQPFFDFWRPFRDFAINLADCTAVPDTASSGSSDDSESDGSDTGTDNSLPPDECPKGRIVRVTRSGTLNLAEVVVYDTSDANVATAGTATQSHVFSGAGSSRAIDGNTNGVYSNGSISNTNGGTTHWWQVDLGSEIEVRRIDLWNRTDSCCHDRLTDATVELFDAGGSVVWSDVTGDMDDNQLKTFVLCGSEESPYPTGCTDEGIAWTSNTVEFSTALPASLLFGDTESDNYIRLYSERCAYTLPNDVGVDWRANGVELTHSGSIGTCTPPGGTIPAGTVIDVYYLHWDSVMEHILATGEIQFERPVLGILLLRPPTPEFLASDALGGPDTQYPIVGTLGYTSRGYECAVSDNQRMTLSADGLNLSFDVGVSWSIDQARIIVAGE